MNYSAVCRPASATAKFSFRQRSLLSEGRPCRSLCSALAGTMIWTLLIFSGQAIARADLLDPTFDGDGKTFAQILPTDNVATNAVLQPDGKILVVGSGLVGQTRQAALVRFNADGSLDASFDGDGKRTVAINSSPSEIKAAAVQPDGKIVAVGIVGSSFPINSFIIRLTANGALDPTFDGDGIRNVSVQAATEASDMALQPDGKILLAGRTGSNEPGFLIARFNPNGSPDTAFGTNSGSTVTNFSSLSYYFNKIALLADGKIVMTGRTQDSYKTVRYTQNGVLDPSFGTGGIVDIYGGNAVVQQPDDGKIVILNNTRFDFAANLWRLNYDGTLDTAFGSGGFRQLLWNDNHDIREPEPDYDLALDAELKIVVGGSIRFRSTLDRGNENSPTREFALARLNRDGSDDLYFGFRGRMTTDMSGADAGTGLLIQPDGKIVLAGDSGAGFSVARYIPATASRTCRPVSDFNGDGKSDLGYFNNNGNWSFLSSLNGATFNYGWGQGTDRLVPADYNGDCFTDLAYFRDGNWEILSPIANIILNSYQLGMAGDLPVPADYDGDDWADPAVFRNGTWLIRQTRLGMATVQFGLPGDKPVPGDYDGDGSDDIAVYRAGQWWLYRSTLGPAFYQFGLPDDKPVAGDYDGDGKTDIAVYRPSEGIWYLLQSQVGFGAVRWGIATDRPVPADYDGDGKTDFAVYRDGDWYVLRSTAGFLFRNYGTAADRPVQNAYIQ